MHNLAHGASEGTVELVPGAGAGDTEPAEQQWWVLLVQVCVPPGMGMDRSNPASRNQVSEPKSQPRPESGECQLCCAPGFLVSPRT